MTNPGSAHTPGHPTPHLPPPLKMCAAAKLAGKADKHTVMERSSRLLTSRCPVYFPQPNVVCDPFWGATEISFLTICRQIICHSFSGRWAAKQLHLTEAPQLFKNVSCCFILLKLLETKRHFLFHIKPFFSLTVENFVPFFLLLLMMLKFCLNLYLFLVGMWINASSDLK